jgi:hypothetical protein
MSSGSESELSENDKGDVHPLVSVTKIDPDEIPEDPKRFVTNNLFYFLKPKYIFPVIIYLFLFITHSYLYRHDKKDKEEKREKNKERGREEKRRERRDKKWQPFRGYTRSGKKIKGRGILVSIVLYF